MGIDTININTTNNNENVKEIKKIIDLEGKCAYFPLADFHNIRIFKKHNYRTNKINDVELEKDIANRLYLALLLFDNVILHCSDPIRSSIVYNILLKNICFVDSGEILFIFANSINNINDDYKNYIIEKKKEYERNEFSDTDIKSLDQEHMTDEYYEKVILLLKKTPYMLKKGKEGNSGFKALIQDDLDSNVETAIMGGSQFGRSHIRLLNLTLYQLLNLKYASGTETINVFDHEKIEVFIDKWETETNDGAPFSRHTIIEQLRKECVTQTGGSKRLQENVIDVIETRLSLLYSKLNCGKHQIIEFHPATEKRSVYSWKYFNLYLTEITNNRNVILNGRKVQDIRSSGEWEHFRNEFLSCMAELNGQVAISQRTEIKNLEPDNEMFLLLLKKHNIVSKYPTIKKILL